MASTLQAFQTPEHAPFMWQGSNGHAALLVHGFPGTPAEMRPVAELLHGHGWTTQGLLLPGFGRDFAEIESYTHDDWADAVATAVTQLRAEHGFVALVGNSVGAALCIRVAAHTPVDGLLLFAPFWRVDNRALDALYPLAKLLFPKISPFKKADFTDKQLRENLLQFMPDADLDDPAVQTAVRELTLPVKVLGQVRAAGREGYRAATNITAPTVIIQGTDDVVARPGLTQKLAARVPGLAALTMVEGDHLLTRLDGPASAGVSAAIAAFSALQLADNDIRARTTRADSQNKNLETVL